MRRRTLLLLWGLLALAAHVVPTLLPAPPAAADFPETSPDIVAYEIDARLNAKTYLIDAKGKLRWRNTSPVEVPEIRLHLYLNAFKNERSTFMRESSGSHRGHKFDPTQPGSIDLTSFKRVDGPELIDPEKLDFVHEDDGNTDDETVVRIRLQTAIPPGGEATFEMAWQSRMPRVFARTGQGGNGAFFMVAQWYPKPGVWEEDIIGGETSWRWNCHQFHGSSEFYADYGTYDVHLTVPLRFEGKLGATGKRIDMNDPGTSHLGRRNENGSVTYRHKAEHVHDFAWVCGEDFELHEIKFDKSWLTDEHKKEQWRVAQILGVPVESLDLPEVTVYFLLQPEHADQLERHRAAVFHALAYMGFWYGPYPYPTLTVVDPDHRGRDAGGMEYPTLITGGTRYVRAARQLSPEGVLVHEFGHQHFYGLVGTNEFRHAWMDEGMNTYATAKVLMKAYDGYAAATWYAGLPVYGQRPFAFGGLAATARQALPLVEPVFDDALKVPFGDLGLVRSIAGWVGVEHPPKRISLWGSYGEVTPLSFLREVPLLTHLRPLPNPSSEWHRTSVARSLVTDPIAGRRAWEYMNRRAYGRNSYPRAAAAMRTIEGYLGEPTMVRIMRTYCQRFRFAHPKPRDFYDVVVEVARKDGKGDVRWLLRELFESDTAFDFGVESISAESLPKLDPKSKEETGFESLVVVRRFGGVRMPIDVRVRFEDGQVRDFLWERDDSIREYAVSPVENSVVRGDLKAEPIPVLGQALSRVTPQRPDQARWVKLRFRGPVKAVSAEVDPYYAYGLDRNRLNDGRTTDSNAGATRQLAIRALGWVQMSTSFYGGL
ncbi:MAG: M1 family metallopeptidase [Planctomycetota bacterium]|nr:M1 family metallopeptidase [Planctomycetota bacterium]